MKPLVKTLIIIGLIVAAAFPALSQETERMYLSGTDKDNTVDWKFFCTEGRKSGKWTKIPVPSNWELRGFGVYNYGLDKDSLRGKEKGLYQYSFKVPRNWEGRTVTIVFEGSMTDTEVAINGRSAGPVHQGAFYQFQYDISHLLNYGKTNLLEATVAKHSSNESVNKAERNADFWIFGGIFRPVYLEAFPKKHIARTAIDAKANGRFTSQLHVKNIENAAQVSAQIFTAGGERVGEAFTAEVQPGDSIIELSTQIASPATWSPEFPNLYRVEFSLIENKKTVHQIRETFGFRTVELRQRDGIYVNGVKIKFRGVNRHTFWPTSGRTVSKEISIKDAQLIKDMNMNAVRMSHYPPDAHFLDVCDSLGLFVINELTGWHDAYDTKVGSRLVGELIARDVNHPSVVLWANGNEGGHNLELDPLFKQLDIQQRPVIHPWQNFGGVDNQHYINYHYGNSSFFQGHDVFFPTEFLHGLYDGGLGAGLKDFWDLMWQNPLSAGGFLWALFDEGVVRTDKNGALDTDGDHGADGILGPYREKEGSYFAIKEVWSPVFFEHREITPEFNGEFIIENRFFYTNINQCTFSWKLSAAPYGPHDAKPGTVSGAAEAPDISPRQKGTLKIELPAGWQEYDILYMTASDPHGRPIYTWSWPISKPEKIADQLVKKEGDRPSVVEQDSLYVATANDVTIRINRNNGLLAGVENRRGSIPFTNGPVLCKGESHFKAINYHYKGDTLIFESSFEKSGELRKLNWIVLPSGWLRLDVEYVMVRTEDDPYGERHDMLGVSFSYPEDQAQSVRYLGKGPYRVWKNRMEGAELGIWKKGYNNTITGMPDPGYDYPEFKGYHAGMYWAEFRSDAHSFTVATENEDIFLRLFTPGFPDESYHTAPQFPTGDISFMHGVTPIGTKSQHPINLGPEGKVNMYFDYWKQRPKKMTLYFDFSEKNH